MRNPEELLDQARKILGEGPPAKMEVWFYLISALVKAVLSIKDEIAYWGSDQAAFRAHGRRG